MYPSSPTNQHRDPTGDNKLVDPAVIPGDTKKSTIIKVNHEKSSTNRSRTNSSSSSSNNNPRHNGYNKQWAPAAAEPTANTRDFVRNDAARSTGGGSNTLPPPRPYKSPDLYANTQTRSFKSDPRNQVLPSASTTSYATVMSNSRTMQYQEKRVNGEIVSQSVHEQENMNHA